MGFALNLRESLSAGLARVMSEELAAAVTNLRAAKEAPDNSAGRAAGIHETRRSIKKLRGILRMMEPRLGSVARQEVEALGNAGRALGAARDSAATLEVIDSLEARRQGHAPSRSLTALRRRLSKSPADPTNEIDTALHALLAIKARIEEWPELPNSFGFAEVGLRESYRRGRSALKKLHLNPEPEAFHTLRKRVKDHWYQVRLFQSMWGADNREGVLRELQECLGDEHNLTVLEESSALVPSVCKLVNAARKELRSRAFSLAGGIYAEKPRDHARRVHALWDDWRKSRNPARKGPGSDAGRRRKQKAA